MLSSLQARLSLAFAFVILLSLLLTGSSFVVLIRGYQIELENKRLAEIAVPMSNLVRLLDRGGASSSAISSYLKDPADEMHVRILLVDNNVMSSVVIEDTQNSLKGASLDIQPHRSSMQMGQVVFSGSVSVADSGSLYYVAVPPTTSRPPPGGDLYPSRNLPYIVAVVVPEQSLGSAWLSVAPFLSIALILSLVVSVMIAYFLARSITKPLVEVTHASEAMAKGQFDHKIVAPGNDEVARLAQSFNEMAYQVGQTHQTLREFLANASHELKTPLTCIQGFAQAMVDGAVTEPAEYARAAVIVSSEAERMRKLVDDLLLLSRMETGQVAMDQRVLNVKELVATCMERFEWQAEKKGIHLQLLADGVIPDVLGDNRQLEQVIGNLLDNALRYTPNGGVVSVKIEVIQGPIPTTAGTVNRDYVPEAMAGRQWVRVKVHNTGSWIPEDELPRVFERFYRSNRDGDRQSDGAGLGLAIVREIVASHHGWVAVRSDHESGTEFEVNLPAQSPKAENRGSIGKQRAGILDVLGKVHSFGNSSKS